MWPEEEITLQLLAEVRDGDDGAVNRLLERHRVAVRRLIDLRMDRALSRRVDASDIAQEVMIEAARRLQAYLQNPMMPFHLWLRQMAKDRIIDAHRRHRVAARRSLDRERPLLASGGHDASTIDLAAQLRDGDKTPASAAAWRELERRFVEACGQLDEQDEEIVLMRHFEQLSNSEVAECLGLTPQAASMRYLRAIRRLKKLLHENEN